MKLLTVYDEIMNMKINDHHYDMDSIHLLNDETDKEMKRLAYNYFKGDKAAHLRKMPKENVYMLYKETDIKIGDKKQAQGITVQYNMADGQVSDVAFFTADMDKVAKIPTVLSYDCHRVHYTEGNVKALKDDKTFYDTDMVKIWGEIGENYDVANKDYGVYWKNQYLLLEKGTLKTDILFDLYRSVKDATGDENCRYSKTDRRLTFTLNGKEEHINILGGTMPEMDGYIYFTKENMMKHVHDLINGRKECPPVFYDGTEVYLRAYSNSKNFEDIIDSKFKDKYLDSLIKYNSNITQNLTNNQEVSEER